MRRGSPSAFDAGEEVTAPYLCPRVFARRWAVADARAQRHVAGRPRLQVFKPREVWQPRGSASSRSTSAGGVRAGCRGALTAWARVPSRVDGVEIECSARVPLTGTEKRHLRRRALRTRSDLPADRELEPPSRRSWRGPTDSEDPASRSLSSSSLPFVIETSARWRFVCGEGRRSRAVAEIVSEYRRWHGRLQNDRDVPSPWRPMDGALVSTDPMGSRLGWPSSAAPLSLSTPRLGRFVGPTGPLCYIAHLSRDQDQ